MVENLMYKTTVLVQDSTGIIPSYVRIKKRTLLPSIANREWEFDYLSDMSLEIAVFSSEAGGKIKIFFDPNTVSKKQRDQLADLLFDVSKGGYDKGLPLKALVIVICAMIGLSVLVQMTDYGDVHVLFLR